MTPDASRELWLKAPLDVRQVLGVQFGNRAPTCWLDRDALWHSFRTDAGPATLRVRTRSSDGQMQIVADAWGPAAERLLELAPRLLGFDDDPSALTPAHPIVRDLWRRNPGLRIGAGAPVMDQLIPAILGQRVKGTEAADSYRAMCYQLGGAAPGPRRLTLPPDPKKLARMAPYLLHRYGVEQSRAQTIVQACSYATRLQQIHQMTAPEAFEFLQRLRGVGPWTAAVTVIATHGWADGVVTGDYHMPNTVAWALANEPRADDARMIELLEPYRGQRWRVVLLLHAGGVAAPKRGPRRATWRDAVELASGSFPGGSKQFNK